MEEWLARLVLAIPVGPHGIKFDADPSNMHDRQPPRRGGDGGPFGPAQAERQPRLLQPVVAAKDR